MLADLSREHIEQFKARMKLWVAPSHVALRDRPDQLSKLHGLAAIDAELYLEEIILRERSNDPAAADPVQFARLLTLSELWVIGMYEFARRWLEEARASLPKDSPHRLLVASMRDVLERIRIPLAKENLPRQRQVDGDFGFAIPVTYEDGTVGWQVGPSAHFSRVALADEVIRKLQQLGAVDSTKVSQS